MQLVADSWQRAEVRDQRSEVGCQNFQLRIAKPGTRPMDGSPKDNFEIRNLAFPLCSLPKVGGVECG